jgi:hypothetical protein
MIAAAVAIAIVGKLGTTATSLYDSALTVLK